jgi:ubiquitin C-terminal hydrolase
MQYLPQSTLGRFYTLFASHEHQDSQELLLFLMDGLHEDLNKVCNSIPPGALWFECSF